MNKIKKNQGFTLIELSIVLVVIGLIAASVMGGSELIATAKMRKVISDVGRFQVAYNEFRTQYNKLPGDIANAKEYWPAECSDKLFNDCNGTGDGKIMYRNIVENPPGSGNYEYAVSNIKEGQRMWQHLNLAGFLPYQYTGFYAPTFPPYRAEPGENAPKAPYLDGCYTAHYIPDTSYEDWYNTGTNFIKMGNVDTLLDCMQPLISTTILYSIDKKMDDGRLSSGVVTSQAGSPCEDTGNDSGYDLAADGPQCVAAFALSG